MSPDSSLKPDGSTNLTNPREKESRFWWVKMYLGCWLSWDVHSLAWYFFVKQIPFLKGWRVMIAGKNVFGKTDVLEVFKRKLESQQLKYKVGPY